MTSHAKNAAIYAKLPTDRLLADAERALRADAFSLATKMLEALSLRSDVPRPIAHSFTPGLLNAEHQQLLQDRIDAVNTLAESRAPRGWQSAG